jgi:hypothetical protein
MLMIMMIMSVMRVVMVVVSSVRMSMAVMVVVMASVALNTCDLEKKKDESSAESYEIPSRQRHAVSLLFPQWQSRPREKYKEIYCGGLKSARVDNFKSAKDW